MIGPKKLPEKAALTESPWPTGDVNQATLRAGGLLDTCDVMRVVLIRRSFLSANLKNENTFFFLFFQILPPFFRFSLLVAKGTNCRAVRCSEGLW